MPALPVNPAESKLVRYAILQLEGLDEFLCRVSPASYASAIGRHVRHTVDHFDSLFAGIASGVVDYDVRDRDSATERDPRVARERAKEAISRLLDFDRAGLETPLRLRARLDAERVDSEILTATTAAREILFVVSHLVHHLAVVRVLLREDADLISAEGVKSPATLAFERITS